MDRLPVVVRSGGLFVSCVLKRKIAMPGFIKPQLATLKSKAPSGEQWIHEIKYDGYRIQIHVNGGKKKAYMRRYYFDLRDNDEVLLDDEGLELPTIERVQGEAARSLADMARDTASHAHNGKAHHMAIEVRDEDGPVMQVRFTFDVNIARH